MGDRDVAMIYDPAFSPMLNHSERIRQDVDMVTARINDPLRRSARRAVLNREGRCTGR